jgi:predicted DNA repair protein MutK
MLAVGGEIILHQAHLFHDIIADFRAIIPTIGGLLEYLFAIIFGLIVGSVVMLVMMGVEKIKSAKKN